MTFSNADKQLHGANAKKSLERLIDGCESRGFLSRKITNYQIGKEGYTNTKQFYAPFLVEFNDNSQWILYSTTSMRTDRIKGQQWDVKNLKELNPLIEKALIVFPDVSEKDVGDFKRQHKKIIDNEEYSVIDGIVSQEQLERLIEKKAIGSLSQGQKKDILGNKYEEEIADILSYDKNLIKWKTNDKRIEGLHYNIFLLIVNAFEINKNIISSIKATSDKKIIGKLPSGGNPKTDVLVTVTYSDNTSEFFTISCKRTSSSSVSVHQYPADTFADVLDKDNKELRYYLNAFQKDGSMKAFGNDNCVKLADILAPYIEILTMWVLGGHGGTVNEKQIANYILIYNNDNITKIHKTEEYCRLLIQQKIYGSFGTPFSWTYASKQRGKSIQLKAKIIDTLD